MSVIDDIMHKETAVWINHQIAELPDRAKFRASSSLRSLKWANDIFDAGIPIPACFCALHATEEAVAAFVSCAKIYGYGDAKMINIKDHLAKATVSLIAQKTSTILTRYGVAIAMNPKGDGLAVRYDVDGKIHYNDASTKLFYFQDEQENVRQDFYDELIQMFGDVDTLKEAVKGVQEARNNIFYATSTDYPTGFDNPVHSLTRESQISLGLIWASIDMKKNEGEHIPFIVQALQTANLVISEIRKK